MHGGICITVIQSIGAYCLLPAGPMQYLVTGPTVGSTEIQMLGSIIVLQVEDDSACGRDTGLSPPLVCRPSEPSSIPRQLHATEVAGAEKHDAAHARWDMHHIDKI